MPACLSARSPWLPVRPMPAQRSFRDFLTYLCTEYRVLNTERNNFWINDPKPYAYYQTHYVAAGGAYVCVGPARCMIPPQLAFTSTVMARGTSRGRLPGAGPRPLRCGRLQAQCTFRTSVQHILSAPAEGWCATHCRLAHLVRDVLNIPFCCCLPQTSPTRIREVGGLRPGPAGMVQTGYVGAVLCS